MRVAAERRADGVYIAAGVALIEPETRHQSTRGDWVEPSRVARLGETKLELANGESACARRPAIAVSVIPTGRRSPQSVRLLRRLRRRLVHTPLPGLQARGRPSLFTRTAVRALPCRSSDSPTLALQCRQCGAPMTA